MSDGRDDRIYRTPLIRFDENNLYYARLHVGWNNLERTQRTDLFWSALEFVSNRKNSLLFTGHELKEVWLDASMRTSYEHEEPNFDVISRCLKESMIIDARELHTYQGGTVK